MKTDSNYVRTYSTILIEAERPLDLRSFCELMARQIMEDEKFLLKGDSKNE